MSEGPLTPERILAAAEEVLRRFGPAKATVVDVARALGVSHGSVYRHFPSKSALRDAVTEQWLHRISAPLEAIAAAEGPATDRLRAWFAALMESKRSKLRQDPELFATYVQLVAETGAVAGHVATLTGQIARIIADGAAQGEFRVEDSAAAARAVFDATTRFHNPIHASEWASPGSEAAFDRVWTLILYGLSPIHEGSSTRGSQRRGDQHSRQAF